MSIDKEQLKKIITEFLSDKNKTPLFFSSSEDVYNQREHSLREFQILLDTVKPVFEQTPQYHPILQLLQRLIDMSRSSNMDYLFFLYVIEALVNNLQQPLEPQPTASTVVDPEKMIITEKDRKALDWLHKYMEHSKGE